MGRRVTVESYIYVLHDPSEVSQRIYVGWSPYPQRRLRQHLSDAKHGRRGNRILHDWLRSLRERSVRAVFEIIETIAPLGDWEEAEIFWIAYFAFVGAKLANGTKGGDGSTGHAHPESAKKIVSAAMRTMPVNPESKTGFKGVKVSKNGAAFRAGIWHRGKSHHIGSYESADLAGVAYDEVARRIWPPADTAFNYPRPGELSARQGIEPQGWSLPAVAFRLPGETVTTSTGYRGVRRVGGRFQAVIRAKHIAVFRTAIEAARAYDEKAWALWGHRAKLNFPRVA